MSAETDAPTTMNIAEALAGVIDGVDFADASPQRQDRFFVAARSVERLVAALVAERDVAQDAAAAWQRLALQYRKQAAECSHTAPLDTTAGGCE